MKILFSSLSDNWNTPVSLYKKLDKEFLFDFDPCPQDHDFDGLSIEWGKRNFVNPPYSEWQKWVEKGYHESRKGKLVVFLLPSRTDTKVFHDYIIPFADEIRFLRGRLRFRFQGDRTKRHNAPFPSMIVIFNKHEVIK